MDLHILILAFPSRRSSDLLKGSDVVPAFRQKTGIAQADALAIHRAERALAGWRIEVRDFGKCDPPILGGGDHGESERMLGRPLDASGEPQQFALLMARSEEHTSELQSLMRISYPVFCLKKKKKIKNNDK